MAKSTRRSDEELAAYHLAKANKARARAEKKRKAAEQQLGYELSRAARDLGITSAEDLMAHALLGRLMIQAFGPGGRLNAKSSFHWEAITKLFELKGDERNQLYGWWTAQGYPLGPNYQEAGEHEAPEAP